MTVFRVRRLLLGERLHVGGRRRRIIWLNRCLYGAGDCGHFAKFGMDSLHVLLVLRIFLCLLIIGCTSGCIDNNVASSQDKLTKNVTVQLVDWHIIGLWVVNCPSAWVCVNNYNNVGIKNITIRYKTYGYQRQVLDTGLCTIEQKVPAGGMKNFTEQALGLVNIESDMLSIELVKVELDK